MAAAAYWVYLIRRSPAPASPVSIRSQAVLLDNEHQYLTEQQLLQNYLAANPPQTDKANLYWMMIQLGDLALNQKNYNSALQWFQKAEALTGKKQVQDVVGAATAEASLGDKSAAIADYREAIKLSDPSKIDNGISGYQAAIRLLGGQP